MVDVPEFIPGSGACLVSKNVATRAGRVRWMVREESLDPADNGWRIFSHIDTAEYLADAANLQILPFNDVCAIEPALIGIYDFPVGSDLQLVDEDAGIKIVDTASGREVPPKSFYVPDVPAPRTSFGAPQDAEREPERANSHAGQAAPPRDATGTRPTPQALVEWEERVPELIAALWARAGKHADLLDLSVDSLATVAHLAVEDADRGYIRPVDHGTAKAAYVAYVGEVALRAGGGDWVFMSVEDRPLDQGNRLVGRPFVERRDETGAARVMLPERAVDALVVSRSADELVEIVRRYSSERVDAPTPVADPRLTGADEAQVTPEQAEQFQDWLEAMHPRLARFEDFITPREWTGGYTRESLAGLEQYVLDMWPDHQSFVDAADLDFTDGAVRYIGETYLRVAGGGWSVDHDPTFIYSGRPVVRFDRENRTPVSPFHLLSTVLNRRSGNVLTSIWDGQSRQVAERRATEAPGWRPRRDPVPGLMTEAPPISPEAAAWIARVPGLVRDLQSWAGDRGPMLDLSRASLSTLAALAVDDIDAGLLHWQGSGPLKDAYVAYLGEVALRASEGTWVLHPGDAHGNNPYVGRPFVGRFTEAGDYFTILPASAIYQLETQRSPGPLFDMVDAFAR